MYLSSYCYFTFQAWTAEKPGTPDPLSCGERNTKSQNQTKIKHQRSLVFDSFPQEGWAPMCPQPGFEPWFVASLCCQLCQPGLCILSLHGIGIICLFSLAHGCKHSESHFQAFLGNKEAAGSLHTTGGAPRRRKSPTVWFVCTCGCCSLCHYSCWVPVVLFP